MYTFFDKHGKKLLAVVGSVLMLAFIMPTGMSMGNRGGSARYGKIDGKEIDANDVDAARANLDAVSHLTIPGQPQMQGMPAQPQTLVQAFFPEQYFGNISQKFQQDHLLYYLLAEEAAQTGTPADEATVDRILTAPVVTLQDVSGPIAIKDVNPAVREKFRPAIRQLLSVERAFERRRSMVKASTPMIDDALAKQTEQVRVRLASFKASDFLKDIAAPTDDQLRSQFDTYAADAAGVGTDSNPFGFGYKIPDKLQLQWVVIPKIEAMRVIEASKAPELWEEDAIMYYQQHPDEFQTPATQPTTRPYSDVKADALTKIREPLIDQLQHKVAARIVQQMTFDAQRARSAGPTTQAAAQATTGYGVAYGSYDYLQKLAADIEKQFGVKVQTVNQGLPVSRSEMQALGGIGESTLDDMSSAESIGVFNGPAYLFALCKPLVSGDLNRLGVYDVLSPAKVLKNQNALYVARVLSAEAAHAPRSLDEVRPAVEKDVKDKLAFSKAADAAQKLVGGAAAAGSLDKVGGSSNVQTSDWFGSQNTDIAGIKNIDDPYSLIEPVFNQLRGITSASTLPRRTVVKRQAKGEAVAVELFDVRTTLNTTDAADIRNIAFRKTMQGLVPPELEGQFVTDWFSTVGVSRRIGFVPDASQQPKPSSTTPPPANNPFTPG